MLLKFSRYMYREAGEEKWGQIKFNTSRNLSLTP
jgi:hypothetical protein